MDRSQHERLEQGRPLRQGVSDQTVAKVRAAAVALGYRPNASARALRTARSQFLEKRLRQIGWHITVTPTSGPFYRGAGSRA